VRTNHVAGHSIFLDMTDLLLYPLAKLCAKIILGKSAPNVRSIDGAVASLPYAILSISIFSSHSCLNWNWLQK